MRKRDALRLHSGDEVLHKATGESLRVLSVVLSASGRYAVIEVITASNTYAVLRHADVR